MIFDYDVFRKRLKIIRELTGYNKYQMAIQANIQYQYYCNIENGHRPPNFKAVIAIANALKVDLNTLLNVSDNQKDIIIDAIEKDLLSISSNTRLLKQLAEILAIIKTQTDVNHEGI